MCVRARSCACACAASLVNHDGYIGGGGGGGGGGAMDVCVCVEGGGTTRLLGLAVRVFYSSSFSHLVFSRIVV